MRALIFDLDGTLVQSEKLKAQSYAVAAQQVASLDEPDVRAIEAYREIVGSARDIASKHVMDALALEPFLRPLMPVLNARSPEQVLTALHVKIYNDLVADPAVIRENEWPHTTALLRTAKDSFCFTGLATMSQRPEAEHVLRSLDLLTHLDAILTREDVAEAKPDPEIYLLAAQRLGVEPAECLVLEDSVMGVRAGVAAGMNVIAVATPFTECALHRELPVPIEWVVRDPAQLANVVRRKIEAHNALAHAGQEQS
jgi:beta-phosphoglucomutase